MKTSFLKKITLVFFLISFIFLQSAPLVFAQATGGSAAPTSQKTDDSSCGSLLYRWIPGTGSFTSAFGNCITGILNVFLGSILRIINWFVEWVVGIAGWFMDYVIYFSVVKFRTNFANLELGGIQAGNVVTGGSASGGDLIYYLWGMIRDFFNIIIFIFIIYHAVRSMIDGFEDTKKKFISLLVLSIVINFSILFVKIAIDISNIFTLQAYTLAVSPKGLDTWDNFHSRADPKLPASYSDFVINSINFSKILNDTTGKSAAAAEIENLNSTFLFQLGKLAMYLFVIYIFLYLGVLFLIRAASFIGAMIFSPIMVAELFFSSKYGGVNKDILGKVKELSGMVKNEFFIGLLKGPAIIFLLYLAGVFANSIFSQGLTNSINSAFATIPNSTSSFSAPFASNASVFFKFLTFAILVQVFFKIVKQIDEIVGSNSSSKWASSASNYLFGRGTAGVGFAGRGLARKAFSDNGVGTALRNRFNNALTLEKPDGSATLAGRLLANSKDEKNRSALGRGINSLLLTGLQTGAKTGLGGLGKAQAGSYNPSTIIAKAAEKVLGQKVDFGKSKGGYEEYDKAADKRVKDDFDKYVAAAKSGITVTEDEVMKKNKVKINGAELSLAQLKDLVDNKNKITAAATGPITLGGEEIKDMDILTKISKIDHAEAKNKLEDETLYSAMATKTEKIRKDKEGEVMKKITEARKQGAFDSIIETARDTVSGRDAVGGGRQAARAEQIKKEKEAKENQNKMKKFIINRVGTSVATIKSLVENSGIPADNVKKDMELIEKFDEIQTKMDLEPDNKDLLKEFDKVSGDVFSAKTNILTELTRYARLNKGKPLPKAGGGSSTFDEKYMEKLRKTLGVVETNKKDYDNNIKDGGKKPDAKGGGDKGGGDKGGAKAEPAKAGVGGDAKGK